jgi:opacity protein-like surface antigen
MKKFLAVILFLVLSVGTVSAADVVQTEAAGGYASYPHNKDMRTATFTVTADGSGNVAIFTFENAETIYGYYLLSVEMKCAADDDAFTVLLYTNTGAPMFSHTTTSGTTGELKNAEDRWPINAAPKIDITGLTAAKIVTVIVTFVR